MEMTTENIQAHRIAYVRRVGPYGNYNVQTMEELKNWARSNNLFDDETVIYGIAQDNPETTEPEKCRYDTCIVVSDEYLAVDNYISYGRIVGGIYEVFKIEHTAQAVMQAWSVIFCKCQHRNAQKF